MRTATGLAATGNEKQAAGPAFMRHVVWVTLRTDNMVFHPCTRFPGVVLLVLLFVGAGSVEARTIGSMQPVTAVVWRRH